MGGFKSIMQSMFQKPGLPEMPAAPPAMSNYAATAGPYQTTLLPHEEAKFQQWVTQNKVPFDPSPTADYDMRGYWRALQAKDPRTQTAVNAFDNQLHFPDVWKTPYHASFSNESIYARKDAPKWVGDKLTDNKGRVLVDETPK